MNTITLGSDPELMIQERQTGKIVSSMKVLNGRTKHDPIDLGGGARMYADNALIEAAMPPSESSAAAVSMMGSVLQRMQTHLGPQYRLVPQSAHVYDKDQLDCKEVWEAGCNPSFNVYSRSMNLPADFTSGLRTGSFHIHVGDTRLAGNTTMEHIEEKEEVIKLLEVFVGCSSILFDKDSSAPARRQLYGKAGEFRPTTYGVEYRVLGNWPLKHPDTTRLCFDLVEYAMGIPPKLRNVAIMAAGEPRVQLAINNNDKDVALRCLQDSGLPYKLLERVKQAYPDVELEKAWELS